MHSREISRAVAHETLKLGHPAGFAETQWQIGVRLGVSK
jgi:hypothetical protein